LRSDGAPPLDQAITPTWTGVHTWSGAAVNTAQGADIASATGAGTLNLTTATGNLVDVTGTTTITAITLGQGMQRVVRFTGALTLTNGASLVLPGGADILTVAGDYAIFAGYASSVVRIVGYFRTAVPYLESSFTATVTGVNAVVTITVQYRRVGNVVTMFLPTYAGTSNSTGKGLSGIPAAIRPATAQRFFQQLTDSVITSQAGELQLATDGTAAYVIQVAATGAFTGTFTNTGAFSAAPNTITYIVN
jgi:hypothetical protein